MPRKGRTLDGSEARRYLVLLIGTLAAPGPATELLRLSQQQPSSFHVVVPATAPQYRLTQTEGQTLADAEQAHARECATLANRLRDTRGLVGG
jgi:hypothetical protein